MDKRREAAMSYKVINVITAIDYIEEHLSEKLDLDIVANAVHYSKYHLHRINIGKNKNFILCS